MADHVSVDTVRVTIDNIEISNVSFSPESVDPSLGETTTISYTLGRPANVTISVLPSGSSAAVRQIVQAGVGGVNHAVWNGKDASEVIVPDNFYNVRIVAEDSNSIGVWTSEGGSNSSPATSGAVVNNTDFDPYKNIPLSVEFDMSDWGIMYLRVNCGSYPYVMIDYELLAPGHHEYYWNGRDDNSDIYAGPYSFYFGAPSGVNIGAILVESTMPEITNRLCNQYRIIPTYGEVSTISYELSQESEVTITITDPDGNYFTTLIDQELQSVGLQEIMWFGTDDDGKFVSQEGIYDVVVEAKHPQNSSISDEHVGAITVYK